MSTRAILDSSPIRPSGPPPQQQQRKPLKRSASTASLLTPPQTIEHKRRYSRSRSRGSDRDTDVDTDSEEEKERDRKLGRLQLGKKRRRTDRLDAVAAALTGEDAENPFWDGAESSKDRVEVAGGDVEEQEDREHERSPTPPVVRFRQNRAPVSPPPSRRRRSVKTAVPVTPKGKSKADDDDDDDDGPVRDSGDNPFLDDSPLSVNDEASPKTPREPEGEKPTITYVFRGVRTTFANPHYNLSPSTRQRALLPVDHPEFSPDPACPPRLLFPEARKRTRSASPTRKRARVAPARVATTRHKTDDEWDDDDSTGLHLSLPKRLFKGP